MDSEIERCLAEQSSARAYLDSDGPDKSGAWAGLCDWLMEECLIRAEMEAGMGASVGAKLPREVCH